MYYYCWCSWLLNLLNHYISNHFFSTRSLIFDLQLDHNNSETTLCQCISFSVWVNAQVGQSHHYHWLSWFKDEICFFFMFDSICKLLHIRNLGIWRKKNSYSERKLALLIGFLWILLNETNSILNLFFNKNCSNIENKFCETF